LTAALRYGKARADCWGHVFHSEAILLV